MNKKALIFGLAYSIVVIAFKLFILLFCGASEVQKNIAIKLLLAQSLTIAIRVKCYEVYNEVVKPYPLFCM